MIFIGIVMSLRCINWIKLYLFICFSFNLLAIEKNVSSSVLSFLDPVNMIKEVTGDFLSKNVYEQRLLYCNSIKNDLMKLSGEAKDRDYKDSQQFLKSLSNEKANGTECKDDYVSALISEITESVSDRVSVWDSYSGILEDFNNFIDRHKELVDEVLVNRWFFDLTNKASFSLEDLRLVEKKVADLVQERESILKRKNALDVQKNEDELFLESLKKEDLEKRQDPLKNNASKKVGLRVASGDDSLCSELEKVSIQKKLELLRMKINRDSYHSNLLGREWDLLKYKYKNILEPALKIVKAKLLVYDSEIKSLETKLVAREQELALLKEDLTKKINIKKDEKSKVTRKVAEVKEKLRLRKESSEQSAYDSEVHQEIFMLETTLLKMKHELDLLDQEKIFYEVMRKKFTLDYHVERFTLLRAEAFYYAGQHDEKALTNHLRYITDIEMPEVSKQNEGLTALIYNIENYLVSISSSKRVELRDRKELFLSYKNTIFLGKRTAQQEHIDLLGKAESYLEDLIKKSNEVRLQLQTLEKTRRELLDRLEHLRKEIGEMVGFRNKWHRSATAINWEQLEESVHDIELFASKFFWDTKDKLNPIKILKQLVSTTAQDGKGFLLSLLLFLITSIFAYALVKRVKAPIDRAVVEQSNKIENRYALFALISMTLVIDNFFLIYGWFYIHFFIQSGIGIWGFFLSKIDSYYLSLFYFVSMILFIFATTKFLVLFNSFNKSMNYFFFSERATIKNMVLLSCLFYTTSLIFPFWMMISSYASMFQHSALRTVLKAGYSLISVMVMFLFLDKDDILNLMPKHGHVFNGFKKWLEWFYYPIFLFCIGIYIIFNPYIGYTNLGWFLLFMIPLSTMIVFGGYFLQAFNRKYFQGFFFNQTDVENEMIDKFDYAGVLYGFSVIASFCIISLLGYLSLSKLWTGDYNLIALWKNISENWTIAVGDKDRLGLVQVLTFLGFLFSGYLITMFLNQAVLKRLFDLFRIDAGLENTISKIFQYIMIVLFIVLAFVAVNLTDFVKYVLVALTFGLSLGMRDQIADFFAGILILLERQLEIGHYIEFVDDKTSYRGTVHKISIRSTTISTVRNFFISIPNKLLISRPIVNWGAGRVAVGMEFDLKVAFGSDPEKVCALIRQVIYENPIIHKVPAVVVRLDEFSEYGMVFFARAFISARKVREQWDIAASIRTQIIKVFKANNIELTYPHRTIHISKKQHEKQPNTLDPIKIHFDNIS